MAAQILRFTVLIAALLGPAVGQDAPAPKPTLVTLTPERVVTPDGSVFVLMPRPTRGLVWWAAWFRMGRKHESEGQRGVAEACAHASLAGTKTHGTSAPEAEEEALTALDGIRRSLRNAALTGRNDGEVSALNAGLADAIARCRNLSDRLAFRRLLSAIPATPPKITTDVDGYLLETSFPTERLDDVAVLMADRRRDAVLRTFHEELAEARTRLRDAMKKPGAPHRSALLLTALEVDSMRRVMIPPSPRSRFVGRQEALDFYRKHHRPGTTSTVILGDFDPKRVRERLIKIFVDAKGSSASVDPGVEEPQQNGPRSKVFVSEDPRFLWAWRPPDDARPDALEVLRTWLHRRLEREFVRERGLASSVRVYSRFPGGSAPSPFLIDLVAPSDFDFRKLELAAKVYLEQLEKGGPKPAELYKASLTVTTDHMRTWESPSRTAAKIARRVGRHPARSLPTNTNTLEAAVELSRRMLSESKRTSVTTRPPKNSGGGR